MMEQMDWKRISMQPGLSEAFIREHVGNLDWHILCRQQQFSETFLRNMQSYVDWYTVCTFQKLSEDFMEEFIHLMKWDPISSSQTLSEDFIRKYKDKVTWEWISTRQTLSEDFIEEMESYIRWNAIARRQILSEDFIEKHQKTLKWEDISEFQTLSIPFIKKHIFNIDILKFNNDKNKFSKEELQDIQEAFISYWKPTISFEHIAHTQEIIIQFDEMVFPHTKDFVSVRASYEIQNKLDIIKLSDFIIEETRGNINMSPSISSFLPDYQTKNALIYLISDFFQKQNITKHSMCVMFQA